MVKLASWISAAGGVDLMVSETTFGVEMALALAAGADVLTAVVMVAFVAEAFLEVWITSRSVLHPADISGFISLSLGLESGNSPCGTTPTLLLCPSEGFAGSGPLEWSLCSFFPVLVGWSVGRSSHW